MFWIGLALFVAAASMGIYWLRVQYACVADPMKTKAVQSAMADAGAAAVADARSEFAVTLDYSLHSMEGVDEILRRLRQRREMPESEITGYATRYGGYVGETIKRRFNADWTLTTLPVDPMRVPMVLRDGTHLFPARWCFDHIVDLNSDSIRRKVSEISNDI